MIETTVLAAEYAQSALAFAVFGLLHSIGVRQRFKNLLGWVAGDFFVTHFWRVIYCVLSYYALYHVVSVFHWDMNRQFDRWLFVYPEPVWQGIMVLHLASLAFLYAALLQNEYLEFWGVKPAWRGVRPWRDGRQAHPSAGYDRRLRRRPASHDGWAAPVTLRA